MKFGLEDTVINKIQQVFEANPKLDIALLFGSRAKGNYREASDIDFALKGQRLTYDDLLIIGVKLDELNLPYKIDLLNYHTINEPALVEHIDRVGVVFYERWKEATLEEVATVQTGPFGSQLKNEQYITGGTPVVTVEHIKDFKIIDFNYPSVTDEDKQRLSKYLLNEGDIIFTRVGSVDLSAYVKSHQDGWMFSSRMLRVRVRNEEINSRFLSYYFQQPKFREHILNISVGATMPSINTGILKSVKVSYPPFYEQSLIASTLSSLDDKIDLLHRQNKTLEDLAQILFKQWFIQVSDDNGEVSQLGKLFDIGIGRTPPRKEQHWFTTNSSDIKWVSIKDMGISGLYMNDVSEYLTQEAVEFFNVPIIPENTVMLSFKMTIGRLAISSEKMVSNEAIAHFKQKENSFFPEFLYLFLKTYSWEQLGSTSSIVEAINSQMIKDILIPLPEDSELKSFKNQIQPIFNKIKTNQIQIASLTQTRDKLLPKLMSGEIRIKA